MTELSVYVFESLWEDEDFVLSRGMQNGERLPLLVMSPALAQPAPGILRQLEHAYELRDELDPTWAVRPLELAQSQGRPTLLLEDPGGEPLASLVGQPWEVRPFLRVAISLAGALGQLHARGLVHKDIKPAYILVNTATAEVRLTGFGIASRAPRERPVPEPPDMIAGTLAYMAPEQTGRMNRSIDARSDLYAYGVILYEMLTGALPFTASDPLEWIHCHIARCPTPPTARAPGIPAPIAAIVMKLLAKTAEERYQTAAGVAADLRRCLAEWETRGRIDSFPLGEQDVSDRLLIPEKLYGREQESEALRTAFERVVTDGTPELMLVSGYAGIGKSAVVHELHRALVPPRGLFASGKCDQYKRDIPYATLARALQSLVRSILSQNEMELSRWRDAFQQAVGSNGQLMVNLLPELELIIGEQPPVVALSPQDAQHRFQLVFRRFLSVFARPDHPLVLFLDDLQWLDTTTFGLLEHLVTEPEVKNLLLIGAYRDNEVSSSHPLMRTLDAIRKADARVQSIVLSPLTLDNVVRLVSETVRCEREDARPLAQLVYEKTAGNPFFMIQFITGLAEERLIAFDPDTRSWTCDLARIRAKGYTDNVVDLLVDVLHRLPAATRETMKLLACLGHSADTATLAMVHGLSKDEIHETLWEAVRAGLVFRRYEAYTFLHDRVQETEYALIPAGERAALHLRIGRLLVAEIPVEKREEAVFEIVSQLNRGAALITSREEREQVAELNLIAGKRAKAATAYASALNYFATGAALLAEDRWERCYALTFALEFHWAECEFLTGEVAAADERLAMLSLRAGALADLAAVTCLRVNLFTSLDRSDRSVEVGLQYLQRLGVHWSPHPTQEEVAAEFAHIWRQLGSRAIEDLVDLPLMSAPSWRATMDVLATVLNPALFTDRNLLCLVIGRMTNLSLEYGHSDGSCFAYIWLGAVMGLQFGDYRTGFRFGQLGLALVERRGLGRFKARVYRGFGQLVNPWTRHVRTGRAFIHRAFATAQETGDLNWACYARESLITHLLLSGDPLDEIQREAETGLAFVRKTRFGAIIAIMTGQLGLIRTLRGLTPTFGCFNDDQFDEDRFEQQLEGNPGLAIAACWYWIRKLQACFFADDYVSAIGAAAKAERLLWTSPSHIEVIEYHFYSALTRAAYCAAAPAGERLQHLAALAAHCKQLAEWAENCPENFGSRAALVAAEIARLEGRELDAEHLYEEAIRLAREHGFIQNEGLANERAARFYGARGFETIAAAYLKNARYCYLRWGAEGKVRQLEQFHPHLHEEAAPQRSTTTIGASIEHLDLATVLKMSQVVSGEIVLEQLIHMLMTIAVEHAGAERGLLLLPHGGAPRIEAEAITDSDAITVHLKRGLVTSAELPETVLSYVLRTQESVVLDDAAAPNQFSTDVYIDQKHARSVLCLPLVKQARLIGVLYLENHLLPHVFTPARIEVLQLLASQAAISLENALLYTEIREAEGRVRRAERELRRVVDTVPALAWTTLPDGANDFCNQGWLDYTGLSSEDTRGSGWMAAFHPEDLTAHQDKWRRAVAAGEVFENEARLRRADGEYRWFLHRGVPLRDDAGRITKWYGTSTDIEDRKQVEQVRTEQARQAAVRADVSTAFSKPADLCEILRGCAEAIVRHIGAAFARIWTQTEDGNTLELQASAGLYTHLDGPHSRIPVGKLKIGLIAEERKPHLTNDVTNDPRVTDQVWARNEGMVAFAGYPLVVEERLVGVMAMFARARLSAATLDTLASVADVIAQGIERKHAEEKLRHSETNLLEAQRLSHTGSWTHDISSGTVTTSPEALRIFGVTPDEDTSTAEFFFNRIHPEDRPSEVRNYERARLTKADFASDYRIALPDGSIKHLHNSGRPIVNASGELLKFVGTTMDVTEQHRARVELEQALEEIKHLKDRLHNENLALREEIDRTSMFEEIVGSSEALRQVLRQVAKVAPTESTVLILGETGTGKELIARAIHKRSDRARRAFIRVNCAAIPPSLIASELFGHEKGAFTGALQRRLGRFESAHGGTIFLDEIGDLPMETQLALLRVLQEREFERVGSNQPIAVDVRVLAATNRDLKAAVTAGAFRQDLFYRLNVFPIHIPSLRERVDDIPLLVEYLIERYAKKAGKKIRNIKKTTLEQFQAYDWPGNIRELQNVIERAVILCDSETFAVDETWLMRESPQLAGPAVPFAATLVEHEREIIEAALAACQGRISGPSGAAAKLGIPRQTLDSKIKNLGINKHRFKARQAD